MDMIWKKARESDGDKVIEDYSELDVRKENSYVSEEELKESFFWRTCKITKEKDAGLLARTGSDILDAFELFFHKEFVQTIV